MRTWFVIGVITLTILAGLWLTQPQAEARVHPLFTVTVTPGPTATPQPESLQTMPVIVPEAHVIDGRSTVDGMPILDVAGAEVVDGRSTVDQMPILGSEPVAALDSQPDYHFIDPLSK